MKTEHPKVKIEKKIDWLLSHPAHKSTGTSIRLTWEECNYLRELFDVFNQPR